MSTLLIREERDTEIYEALNTRDSEALYTLASLEKEEGNNEEAERLLKAAKRIDDEDMSFDRERDNQM